MEIEKMEECNNASIERTNKINEENEALEMKIKALQPGFNFR